MAVARLPVPGFRGRPAHDVDLLPKAAVQQPPAGRGIDQARQALHGIADDRRGERLAALYACPEIGPAELWRRLAETDLPRLWLPKQDHLYQVDALPQLGTGKLDLRGVKCLAQELAFSVREHRAQA